MSQAEELMHHNVANRRLRILQTYGSAFDDFQERRRDGNGNRPRGERSARSPRL